MRLAAWIINRDHGICWRCGHPGADTCGHILPYKTHPHLALDPDNLRAEHGRRRHLEVDGYDCIGNYAAKADAGQLDDVDAITALEAQRRDWLTDDPRFFPAEPTKEALAPSESLSPRPTGDQPVSG